MTCRCVKYAAVCLVILALMACGNPQEEARIKLGQMNVKYNEDTFADRAKDGDVLVVKLFLEAGMSPNVTEKDKEPKGKPAAQEKPKPAAKGPKKP